ncbi:porin family protein [Rhodomicrobium sp. Az07]|uniref:outer membrane protein n=1 Tax=Rhodomicrobium sp. Az07 TaxID=2839034 RepID=UPI001BE6B3EE|nr:outer membrane protein [Rhodomicrobium sp. Az07]MBT3069727.1 porin family protein [Rhodomicrobium sp. Az07]
MSSVRESARLACVVGGVLLAANPALGADLYSRGGLKDGPVYEAPALWQGFYIGGHVGAGWSKAKLSDTYAYNRYDPHYGKSFEETKFTGGGQIGYNVQRGNVVFGVEGEIGYLGFDGSQSAQLVTGNTDNLYADYSVSGDLYGAVTGKVGYAADRWLLYFKGGVAFLNAEFDSTYVAKSSSDWPFPNGTFYNGGSDTLVGWTIGAGIEYALTQNWALRGEYQYFDFGDLSDLYYSKNLMNNGYGGYTELESSKKLDVTASTLRVGLSYRVSGSGYADLK